MLRESATVFGYKLNLEAIRDPSIDIGVPGGNLLLRLVDAVLTESEPLADVHSAVIGELGPAALLDAASVFGNFEMMNRIADASGIPIPAAGIEREKALVELLDITGFLRH